MLFVVWGRLDYAFHVSPFWVAQSLSQSGRAAPFCFCPTTTLLASNLRLGENKNKSPQFLAGFCAKLCRGD